MLDPSNTFMIVPAWFSNEVKKEEIDRLFTLTFEGASRIAPPENQFLYLDGIDRLQLVAERVLSELSLPVTIENAQMNRGKGAGVLTGLQKGLEKDSIQWFAVRDADGDHRVEDFTGLAEAGRQIEKECGDVPILVVGGRYHLEPPLSLYRAMYEKILNACIESALHFTLAKQNYFPMRSYFCQYRPYPDLQSGYKLYNRKAAELAVQGFESDEENQFELLRWGAEIVPYVWNVLHRAVIGEKLRSTYREQPVTAYGSIKRAEFYAQKLVWVFRTCEISMWNAARMLDGELAYVPLMFDAMGKMELMAFRRKVLEPLRRREADDVPSFREGVRFF